MLACILGNSGEIFFPKLDEKQMLTFSVVCDRFLCALGFKKRNVRLIWKPNNFVPLCL